MIVCSDVCEDCERVTNVQHTSNTEDLIRVVWESTTAKVNIRYYKEPLPGNTKDIMYANGVTGNSFDLNSMN
jgi:hypothetical protein